MPVFFQEQLDDVLQFDGVGSFVGGQVSGTRANLLKEDESAQLVNCDVTRTGELRTRRGTVNLTTEPFSFATFIQGLGFYESSSTSYPVAASNVGAFYKYNGSTWDPMAIGVFTYTGSTDHIQFATTTGGKMYVLVPGIAALHYWNGTTWTALGTTTNSHPPANPSWMTWHTRRLVVVGGPTEPEALYFSQFLDGTTWDRTKWSLSVASTVPHQGVVAGDATPITGLCSWTDFNLIVMKRNSLWVINCDPQLQIQDVNDTIAGFQIKPIHLSIGCLAPYTACQVNDDVYMLTTSGVRSAKRTLATEQTSIGDPLSYPIQDIIDRINPNAIATATACFWNNRYLLALPLDGASQPNYVAVYNVLTQSWHGLWSGWIPTCFSTRTVNGVPRLIFGQSDGAVLEWLDYVADLSEVDETFQDDGVDIPTTVLTKSFDFKEPVCKKQLFNCQFEFNKSLADVIVQVIRDGADPEAYQQFPTHGEEITLPVDLPFVLPSAGVKRRGFGMQQFSACREVQFKLTTASKKLVVRSMIVGGMVNTIDLEIL